MHALLAIKQKLMSELNILCMCEYVLAVLRVVITKTVVVPINKRIYGSAYIHTDVRVVSITFFACRDGTHAHALL